MHTLGIFLEKQASCQKEKRCDNSQEEKHVRRRNSLLAVIGHLKMLARGQREEQGDAHPKVGREDVEVARDLRAANFSRRFPYHLRIMRRLRISRIVFRYPQKRR